MTIYSPEEDSYLLANVLKKEIPKLLKKNKNLKFLEVGCGSGIILQTVLDSGFKRENIFGCDINPKAVKHCKKLGFNCIKSNLFSNVKGFYDVIAFNPPYLPEDKREPRNSRRETTGGKLGNERSVKFLKQSKKHLAKNGKIFLVTSSLAKNIDFKKIGYKAKKVSEKKLFFESLFVWEISLV